MHIRIVRWYLLLLLGLGLYPVYLFLRVPQYGKVSASLAWVICGIAVVSWTRWKDKHAMPLLQIVMSLYAIYFSFSVFMPTEMRLLYSRLIVSETLLREVMLLVILTQCSIWLAWEIARKSSSRPVMSFDVRDRLLIAYAGFIVIVQYGLFVVKQLTPGLQVVNYIQIINGFANMYYAMGILFYFGTRDGWKAWIVIGIGLIVMYQFAISVNNTMLGEAVMPFFVLGILILQRHRLFALSMAGLMIGIAVLLQPIKHDYRKAIQQQEMRGLDFSLEEKAELYVFLLKSYWFESRVIAFQEETAQEQISKRLSLVPLISVILKETPESIPYQYGYTFRYLWFTPVPRFIYEDKPTAQEANIWFAKTYGILDDALARTTMVGISHIGEVYVNFGWLGIPLVFFVFGYLLSRLSTLASAATNSIATKAIPVALLPAFFSIESTLTSFISSTIYTLVFTYIVLKLLSSYHPRAMT